MECRECTNRNKLDFEFTMAFQPIVNLETQTIFAHEALVRGLNNESAQAIFQHINDSNRYLFDQSCRTTAIRLAAELHIPCFLSINFLPNAVYEPERCIRTTLEAAETYGFPIEQIIFEITESEQITDLVHLRKIVEYYRARGFKTAIDDFGAGYAGLNLLSEIQTDLIKLDMALIRGIDRDKVRQAIVKGVLQVAGELSSLVIAEGIETQAELSTLQGLGINLFQGFYFAKPTFQSLAQIPSDRFANVA
ncbi:EAL domain-containing protein [Picosynechococcus sp. PCC 11901]|nr:EAL domain-containing protein [Picosynechococcus sp. PCC 11901]